MKPPCSKTYKKSSWLAFIITGLAYLAIFAGLALFANGKPEKIVPAEQAPIRIELHITGGNIQKQTIELPIDLKNLTDMPEKSEEPVLYQVHKEQIEEKQSEKQKEISKPRPIITPRQHVNNNAKYDTPELPLDNTKTNTPPVQGQKKSLEEATQKQQVAAKLQSAIEKNKYYPKSAQRSQRQGNIQVIVLIGENGEIEETRIIGKPDRLLADGARQTMNAVKKNWQYQNWKEGRMEFILTIIYRLD